MFRWEGALRGREGRGGEEGAKLSVGKERQMGRHTDKRERDPTGGTGKR